MVGEEQELRIRIKHDLKTDLINLAKIHDRSPTAEVNHIIRHYIGANKSDVDKVRQTAGQPQRKES